MREAGTEEELSNIASGVQNWKVGLNPNDMKSARVSNRPMPINMLAGAGAVLLLV